MGRFDGRVAVVLAPVHAEVHVADGVRDAEQADGAAGRIAGSREARHGLEREVVARPERHADEGEVALDRDLRHRRQRLQPCVRSGPFSPPKCT